MDVEEKTTYDWTYQYGSNHPHAPTKIGQRIYTYDLNGNQLGWTYPPEPEPDHAPARSHPIPISLDRLSRTTVPAISAFGIFGVIGFAVDSM